MMSGAEEKRFESTLKKLWDAGKRKEGGTISAGASEANAPSERWGIPSFFFRRWDPQFYNIYTLIT